MESVWTEDRLALLKELVEKGMSASQTAVEMSRVTGYYFSRNSVIGKIHRSGLILDRVREKYVRPPRTSKMTIVIKRKPQRLAAIARQVVNLAEPETTAIEVENLERHHCRWPEGEGSDIRFCGADCVDDFPYCPHHCLRAYRRP